MKLFNGNLKPITLSNLFANCFLIRRNGLFSLANDASDNSMEPAAAAAHLNGERKCFNASLQTFMCSEWMSELSFISQQAFVILRTLSLYYSNERDLEISELSQKRLKLHNQNSLRIAMPLARLPIHFKSNSIVDKFKLNRKNPKLTFCFLFHFR